MCPCCGLAPYVPLGALGSKLWARCRWCGCDFEFDPDTWGNEGDPVPYDPEYDLF